MLPLAVLHMCPPNQTGLQVPVLFHSVAGSLFNINRSKNFIRVCAQWKRAVKQRQEHACWASSSECSWRQQATCRVTPGIATWLLGTQALTRQAAHNGQGFIQRPDMPLGMKQVVPDSVSTFSNITVSVAVMFGSKQVVVSASKKCHNMHN